MVNIIDMKYSSLIIPLLLLLSSCGITKKDAVVPTINQPESEQSLDSSDNILDQKVEYFEGPVKIVSFNVRVTRFQLANNSAVIDVLNDVHLRIVDDWVNLPKVFNILAPMSAVTLIEGDIPSNQIQTYSLNHYIEIRDKLNSTQAENSPQESNSEKFINKENADLIFSFNRKQWESYVKQVVVPEGWVGKLMPAETGTVILSFNPENGTGVSTQPLFRGYDGPPKALIVGSWFAPGLLPPFTEEMKQNLENLASEDLGSSYSVSVRHANMSTLEGIEALIIKKK